MAIRGHIFAIFTIIVWGITFIATRVLLDAGIAPFEVLVIRFVMAYFILLALRPKMIPYRGLKHEVPFILCGFFGVTLYYLAENTALLYTLASNVGIISATAPFMTAIVFWILFKERPSMLFVIGFVVAIAGVALVSGGGGSQEDTGLLGDAIAFLAATLWAGYNIGMRKIDEVSAGDNPPFGMDDVLLVTRRIFFWGALTTLCGVPFLGFRVSPEVLLHVDVVICLVFLTILGSVACYVTWNSSIRILGEVKSSIYIYAIPAVTCVSSWLVLNEQLTWQSWLGLAFILGGLVISQIATRKAQITDKNPVASARLVKFTQAASRACRTIKGKERYAKHY